MTKTPAIRKDPKIFGQFEPVEMYIWLDGPRTFTLLDEDGQLCLAHWLQEVGPLWQYVVVPVTASILGELNSGQQTLADVLKQPRVYLVSVRPDFTVEQVSLIAWESLPKDALPAAGTMIRRDLEPFLRIKSIGDTIRPGSVPGSVIRTTVQNAQKAIRLLVEYELDHPGRKGPRSIALRSLCDLPAQRMQAASFEVSFRAPLDQPSLFDRPDLREEYVNEERLILERVCEHLRLGIAWLESRRVHDPDTEGKIEPGLKSRILEAIKHLTPPVSGAIQQTEISGTAFRSSMCIRLDRADRRRVASMQRATDSTSPRRFEATGTIIDILGDSAEINVDFQLNGETRPLDCRFSDDLWDAYGEKLRYNQLIRVYGYCLTPKGPVTVLAVEFPDTDL